jgi:hypothetical protein
MPFSHNRAESDIWSFQGGVCKIGVWICCGKRVEERGINDLKGLKELISRKLR